MDVVLQIALIIFPAGAVLLTTIFFLRKESSQELRSMQIEMKKQRQEFQVRLNQKYGISKYLNFQRQIHLLKFLPR